jgi:hypothetical protein
MSVGMAAEFALFSGLLNFLGYFLLVEIWKLKVCLDAHVIQVFKKIDLVGFWQYNFLKTFHKFLIHI